MFTFFLKKEQKQSLEEITLLAEAFKPIGATLMPNENNISQPFLLKNTLRFKFKAIKFKFILENIN